MPVPNCRLLPFLTLLAAALLCRPVGGAEFSWISAEGTNFVDESGEPVVLRGCNVGNWLLIETWMLGIDRKRWPDQYTFENTLTDRFGADEKNRLMDLYRSNWVTPRDFDIVRSFGFNVIRLPFNYRLLQDDADPFGIKPDAFEWLDRAVAMAEDAGLYVILDMHGVPGGQSVDHPTGREKQNLLWEDPVYATRTAKLWARIAAHYKDRPSIAAYDVINEPYSDFHTDVRTRLNEIFEEIYDAIRAEDQRHVVLAPAALWGGLGFYGVPAERGWTRVGFTEHHYPGLFGGEPSLRTHRAFIEEFLPEKQRELEAAGVPMLIGEWNPAFGRLGGGDLMRRYFDEYGSRGWAATIWSYKILNAHGPYIRDNWYMVTNGWPNEPPDFENDPIEDIEEYFEWLGSMEYVVDVPMRLALTRPDPVEIVFPEPGSFLTEPPAESKPPYGWLVADVGEPLEGGQSINRNGIQTLYAGGRDIWADADDFRFLYTPVAGDFTITARVESLEDTHHYAKAGLMVRLGLEPDAPHALVHVFPDGGVALGWRHAPGALMSEQRAPSRGLPVFLRLSREGDTVSAASSPDGEAWTPVGEPVVIEDLGPEPFVGAAAMSHRPDVLTAARFSRIVLDPPLPEPEEDVE